MFANFSGGIGGGTASNYHDSEKTLSINTDKPNYFTASRISQPSLHLTSNTLSLVFLS